MEQHGNIVKWTICEGPRSIGQLFTWLSPDKMASSFVMLPIEKPTEHLTEGQLASMRKMVHKELADVVDKFLKGLIVFDKHAAANESNRIYTCWIEKCKKSNR